MEGFMNARRESIPNIGQYVKDYVAEHDDVTVMVGCDAADKDWNLHYATVVILYHEGKGGHYLFRKDSVRKKSRKKLQTPDEIFNKIWGEVERIFDLCEYLESVLPYMYKKGYGQRPIEAHLDINPDPAEESHVVYAAAMGFLKGAGYETKGKPRSWASMCTADMLLR